MPSGTAKGSTTKQQELHLTRGCRRRLPAAADAQRWVAGRSLVAWRDRGYKKTMFAGPRPGVRRGLRRWSGGHLCRPLTPCTLVGVARARAGVWGRRGSPQAPAVVRLGGGARPCWLHGACRGLVSRPRHQGHGRGMGAWRRVLHHERGGVSCIAWGLSAGSGGGGQGRRQRRAPAGPGTRRGGLVLSGGRSRHGGATRPPLRGPAPRQVPWSPAHRAWRQPAARAAPAGTAAGGHREARAPASVSSHPTRVCRRRETASARASLRLFPAPET